MKLTVRLWSINRFLRWLGVRLFVEVTDAGPTRIGLTWYGWSFVGHEPAVGRWDAPLSEALEAWNAAASSDDRTRQQALAEWALTYGDVLIARLRAAEAK